MTAIERPKIFQGSVREAKKEADRLTALVPWKGPEIGKQLRREAGSYLWKATLGRALWYGFLAGVAESAVLLDQKGKNFVVGGFILAGLLSIGIAAVQALRISKASIKYSRMRG